jgi:hypothetical protein
MVVHAVIALKWLSLSLYESVVPRMLRTIRAIEVGATSPGNM